MTQDMIKTIRTIKMMNNGKSAQREPSLLCTSHKAQTVRLARTTTQARADHQSGWGGLWRSALLLLVMMMTVGVGKMWGEETPDYSGTYFIVSGRTDQCDVNKLEANFYLCPTEGWYFYDGTNSYTTTDNGKPFLTTYNCLDGSYDASKAVWVIEKHPETGCYYIKQKKTTTNNKYRYLVSNGKISGSSSARRMRVHLEEVADANALETLGDKALFEIIFHAEDATCPADHLDIIPHSSSGWNGSEKRLVVNYSNINNLKASTDKPDGPNGTYGKGTGGIIGVYSTEPNEMWHLEVPRPVISFDANNKVQITDPTGFASAIYYTTDGNDPTTSSTPYAAAFSPAANVTTIKAIAVVDGKESEVTTFTPQFFLGSTHNYLIQSKDCKFYNMIPNLSVDANTKNVSTLNVPCSTMAWHFENAEEGYYYIVDKNGWYMYYTENTDNHIYLKSSKDESDAYKFSITAHTNGGYSIIPKGLPNPIYKPNSGTDPVLQPVKYGGELGKAVARWDIIPFSTTNLPMWETTPFNVSTDDVTNYYTITPLSKNTDADRRPLIINNDGVVNSQKVPTGLYVRKTMWIIKKVGAYDATDNTTGDNSELLDYYTIQNAYTGDLIYYNGNENGDGRFQQTQTFQMGKPSVTGADETWSHFVIVQTANNGYNIIPRIFVDNVKAINRTSTPHYGFNCLNRSGGKDILGTFFDDGGSSRWTFSKVNFCMPPVFEESDGSITISCDTKGAEIHFLTDGNDPTEASTLYNNNNWSSSNQIRIKAIAVVKEGETITASSDVYTLLNKPDITLEAGPYEYKGAAWEPSLTVSIGESGSETTAPTSPASYTTAYTDNVNAGTATVTLADADPTDTWYIWNGSTTFTITQKAITITADSDTKGYDRTPLTKNSYTCSPALATGDSFKSVTVTGSQTAVGNSSNVPSAAVIKNGSNEDVTANYAITYTNGTLTVTLRSIGNGLLASGFTLEFGKGGAIILKDGDETLTENIDYNIGSETTSESGRYTQRTVYGTDNYEGNFFIRNANVNFQNDGNGGTEYSATFVAENALGSASNNPANGHALPEGITAYIITSISGNNANAEALEYIPEGIPVLLLSNAASGGFLVQDASGHAEITSTQISNNMLEEVSDPSKHFDTREIYLLYNNEFVHNMEGDLAKGKVYLNPSHTAPDPDPTPSRLFIRWDTKTGIDNPHLTPLTPHPSGPWYTLDGRRLNRKPTQKGLYLCNGQKMVVN